MTCPECRKAATENRFREDGASALPYQEHPDCSCTCQHEPPVQWEKMYSTERPVIETNH